MRARNKREYPLRYTPLEISIKSHFVTKTVSQRKSCLFELYKVIRNILECDTIA